MLGKQRLRALFFFLRPPFVFRLRFLASYGLPLVLVGCASSSNLLSDVAGAVVAQRWGAGKDVIAAAKLNPNLSYLRVDIIGRQSALLVLGYVDPDPQGDIEVWYSAEREVIKTQNGRIVATFGLETDWRAVRFSPSPALWDDTGPEPRIFERIRDEMPGYRFGLSERVESRYWPGAAPAGAPAMLTQTGADALRWFRESVEATPERGYPPSWYAWGKYGGQATVVYSEQCLAPAFCLRLMRWPLQGSAG